MVAENAGPHTAPDLEAAFASARMSAFRFPPNSRQMVRL